MGSFGGGYGGGYGGYGGGYGGGMSRPAAPSVRPAPGGGQNFGSRPSTGAIGNRPATGVPGPGGVGGNFAGRPGPGGLPGGAGTGFTPGGRPTAGQLNDFLNVPRPSTGAINGARPGGAANDFLRGNVATQLPAGGISGNRPSQLPAGGVNRPSQLPGGIGAGSRPGVGSGAIAGARGDFAGNRPQRVENRQQLQQDRQQRRDEIRDQVGHDHPWRDFWGDHPGWAAWRITRPYRWATWGALSSWCSGYGWSTATPYNYGENVYYQDDQVYYGDQPVATADQYTQQAAAIAASAPNIAPQNTDWMPLGVFALAQDGQATGVSPTIYMQLAISKEGIISGTMNNSSTGKVQTLEGMADKGSQRCAWTVTDQQRPIVETGISNLTQDTAPVLIHFADGQTQQWLLVRLEEPKEGSTPPKPS